MSEGFVPAAGRVTLGGEILARMCEIMLAVVDVAAGPWGPLSDIRTGVVRADPC
jgi:hypothetical protein